MMVPVASDPASVRAFRMADIERIVRSHRLNATSVVLRVDWACISQEERAFERHPGHKGDHQHVLPGEFSFK
eukprot:845118-Heterocapsa_arctica.AAC.1